MIALHTYACLDTLKTGVCYGEVAEEKHRKRRGQIC